MDEARHGLIDLNLPIEEYAWRWQLAEEVVARLKREVSTAESHIQELEAHIGRLREALEKYADKSNYDGTPSAIDFDDGELARNILSSTPADSLERLRKLEATEILFHEVLNALAAPTESGMWDAFDWRGWVERAITLDALEDK